MKRFASAHFSTMALAAGLILLAPGARADYVLGSWQTSTAEGWLGANGLSITDPSNTGIYSFQAAGVSGYGMSLQINKSGFGGVLQDKLEYNSGQVAAFLNNHILSFTFSVPASAQTSGYNQIYALNINATGYGYNNVGNGGSWPGFTSTGNTNNNSTGGQPNYYYFGPNPLPLRTQTVSFDYSSILPLITATPSSGYIELTFTFNNDGAAPDSFELMNNVVLSGGPVPEPTTGALALLGGGLLLALRRRKA